MGIATAVTGTTAGIIAIGEMDTGIIMVGGIAIGATGIGATVIIVAITSSIAGTIITTHISRFTGAMSTRGTATASVCAGGERGVKG